MIFSSSLSLSSSSLLTVLLLLLLFLYPLLFSFFLSPFSSSPSCSLDFVEKTVSAC